MPDNKIPKKMLIDSSVKQAILFLTSNQIPDDENFPFVLDAISEFGNKGARSFLYESFYDEILEWSEFNAL